MGTTICGIALRIRALCNVAKKSQALALASVMAVATIALLALILWKEGRYPSWDAAQYIQSATRIVSAFREGGFFQGLRAVLVERTSRGTLVSPFAVPALWVWPANVRLAIKVTNILLFSLLVFQTNRILRLSAPRSMRGWALVLVLCQPFVLATGTLFMSELPFLVAAAGAMASYTLGQLAPEPRLPLATGAWLGLAACIRPDTACLVFGIPILVALAHAARTESWSWPEISAFAVIVGVPLAILSLDGFRPTWVISPRLALVSAPAFVCVVAGRRIGLQRAFVTLFALPFAISIAWFAQSTRIFHWLRESMDSSSLRYIQATFFADVPIPKEHPASYLAYAVGRLGTVIWPVLGLMVVASISSPGGLRAVREWKSGLSWRGNLLLVYLAAAMFSPFAAALPSAHGLLRPMTSAGWLVSLTLVMAAAAPCLPFRTARWWLLEALALVFFQSVLFFVVVNPDPWKALAHIEKMSPILRPSRLSDLIPAPMSNERTELLRALAEALPAKAGHLHVGLLGTASLLDGAELEVYAWEQGLSLEVEGPFLTERPVADYYWVGPVEPQPSAYALYRRPCDEIVKAYQTGILGALGLALVNRVHVDWFSQSYTFLLLRPNG